MKKLLFITILFGAMLVAASALAAEPKGNCVCLKINGTEDVFDATETDCKTWAEQNPQEIMESGCAWAQIGEPGCFCGSCKLKVFNTEMKTKQIAKPQSECAGNVSVPIANCTDCEWYDPGIENGCFCDLTIATIGITNRVYTKFDSKKCKGDVKDNLVTWKNCAWKNTTPPPTQSGPPSGGTPSGGTVPAGTGGISTAPVDATIVKLENPLGAGRTDIGVILGDIIKYAMGILGSLTLLVFVFGGFLWLTSAGSDERVKKGSQTMLWAVIGIFIIFASYGILTLVLKAIGAK